MLDGELILVHPDNGKFFALKDVGLHIWSLLDSETKIGTISSDLTDEYDVTPHESMRAVHAFADQLVSAGFAEYF